MLCSRAEREGEKEATSTHLTQSPSLCSATLSLALSVSEVKLNSELLPPKLQKRKKNVQQELRQSREMMMIKHWLILSVIDPQVLILQANQAIHTLCLYA